jgi:hypothetical protein
MPPLGWVQSTSELALDMASLPLTIEHKAATLVEPSLPPEINEVFDSYLHPASSCSMPELTVLARVQRSDDAHPTAQPPVHCPWTVAME